MWHLSKPVAEPEGPSWGREQATDEALEAIRRADTRLAQCDAELADYHRRHSCQLNGTWAYSVPPDEYDATIRQLEHRRNLARSDFFVALADWAQLKHST